MLKCFASSSKDSLSNFPCLWSMISIDPWFFFFRFITSSSCLLIYHERSFFCFDQLDLTPVYFYQDHITVSEVCLQAFVLLFFQCFLDWAEGHLSCPNFDCTVRSLCFFVQLSADLLSSYPLNVISAILASLISSLNLGPCILGYWNYVDNK